MKKLNEKKAIVFLSALFLALSIVSSASAQEYKALSGVDQTNVFFDVRDTSPEFASDHVQFIHETYKQLTEMKKNPRFVVVFMAGAVKLISSNRAEFDEKDHKHLDAILEAISKMSKDGIDVVVCLAAVQYFGIDPASIPAGIRRVPNGWVSEIGFQAKGYSVVPVY